MLDRGRRTRRLGSWQVELLERREMLAGDVLSTASSEMANLQFDAPVLVQDTNTKQSDPQFRDFQTKDGVLYLHANRDETWKISPGSNSAEMVDAGEYPSTSPSRSVFPPKPLKVKIGDGWIYVEDTSQYRLEERVVYRGSRAINSAYATNTTYSPTFTVYREDSSGGNKQVLVKQEMKREDFGDLPTKFYSSNLAVEQNEFIINAHEINHKLVFTIGATLYQADGSVGGLTVLAKNVRIAAAAGDKLFFKDNSSDQARRKLGATDGTVENTHWLVDWSKSYQQEHIALLMPDNRGFAYFLVNKPDRELWRTDGTPKGTYRVSTLGVPGGKPVQLLDYPPFKAVYELPQGRAVFQFQSINALEFWATDGTDEGTFLLSIAPKNGRYELSANQLGDLVFFEADHLGQNSLWQTDGTKLGTFPVQDQNGNVARASDHVTILGKAQLGETTYGAFKPGQPFESWVTNGTFGGARKLSTAVLQNQFPAGKLVRSFAQGDRIYWLATNTDNLNTKESYQLWVSDSNDFSRITPPNSSVAATEGVDFSSQYLINQKTVYVSKNFLTVVENNTARQIVLPKDLNLSPIASTEKYLILGDQFGGVWSTNDSMTLVRPIGNPSNSTRVNPNAIATHNNVMYFLNFSGNSRRADMYRTDGTPEGTLLLGTTPVNYSIESVTVYPYDSQIAILVKGSYEREKHVFIINETSNKLNSLPENYSGSFRTIGWHQGRFYVATSEGLWEQDLKTLEFTKIPLPPTTPAPSQKDSEIPFTSGQFVTSGDVLYYARRGQLWRINTVTRETSAILLDQTGELVDLHPVNGGRIFARLKSQNYLETLIVTDGTTEGTERIAENSYINSYYTYYPKIYNNPIGINSIDKNQMVYSVSGTTSPYGTLTSGTINLVLFGEKPGEAKVIHGYNRSLTSPDWAANYIPEQREMGQLRQGQTKIVSEWSFNNAVQLKSIDVGTGNELVLASLPSSPNLKEQLTQKSVQIGNWLYFVWHDPEHGVELWRTDGTIANTSRYADIHPGPQSSDPRFLQAVGTNLHFIANDGLRGFEPWIAQGRLATPPPAPTLPPTPTPPPTPALPPILPPAPTPSPTPPPSRNPLFDRIFGNRDYTVTRYAPISNLFDKSKPLVLKSWKPKIL